MVVHRNSFYDHDAPSIFSTTMRLPPELVDLVLDNLFKYPETLKQCALVCREWLPAIRRLLFYKIYLYRIGQYAAFNRLIASAPGITHCVKELVVGSIPRDLGSQASRLNTYPSNCIRFFESTAPVTLIYLNLTIAGETEGTSKASLLKSSSRLTTDQQQQKSSRIT
jgi:hypothetical protein